MLEKIGLPAKPSLGGSSWVVDASHCQGCSSQFTFINRKHHCRRCGGIFCGGCTQNRMVLRGQGDSPVRICEPCKKLEEAARFEMRNRYKSRAAKGRSKLASKHEVEALEQILGVVQRETSSSKLAPDNDIVRTISSASCSTVQGASFQDAGEILNFQSDDEGDNVHNEMTSVTPEELRLQASNEKKKYKILKGEGKSDEALRAFKRGKELERQAEALEISLRRKRKKDLPSGKDAIEESGRTHKISHKESKEKDDFTAELRALGWSDMDPHDDEKKQPSVSLEGELASLIGKNTKKSSSHVTNKSEIVALKKKALTFKREGKLAEAKEELKRAKILEKQFEEQELLAEAEDSDDELSAIVRAMDDNKEDAMFSPYKRSQGLDFDDLLGAHENVSVDGNFEVTDDDMEDPELAATLTSLGWTEDSNLAVKNLHHFSAVNKDALMAEILSLKKEALSQKRAGNVSEAMAQLKRAKLLERSLESFDCQTENSTPQQTEAIESSAAPQTGEHLLEALRVGDGYVDAEKDMDVKHATRSRLMIQKELLGVKRKALALRREGRYEEAEEELKKAKTLEHQLEQIEKDSNIKSKHENTENKVGELTHGIPSISESLEVTGVDVTDRDLNDPTYLSVLRNLGWNDDDTEIPSSSVHPPKDKDSAEINEASLGQSQSRISVKTRTINKGEIQRELLGLKRKALALRRQGNTNEAEEVLEAAKSLEAEMAEIEAPKKRVESSLNDCEVTEPPLEGSVEEDEVDVSEKDMNDPMLLSVLRDIGWKDEEIEPMAVTKKSSRCVNSSPSHFVGDSFNESSFNHSLAEPKSKREIQRELLGLKRKALALRRNGQTEEADDLLKRAMVLEAQMVELEAQKHELSLHARKEEKSGSLEALTDVEKQRDKSIESVVASVGRSNEGMKSLMDSGKMGTENDFNMLIRKAPPSTEENKLSLKKVDPSSDVGLLADVKRVESTSFVCPPGDSTNIANLLTGNDWTSSQADKPEGKEKLGLKLSSSAEHTQKGISDEHSEVMQSGQKLHRHEDNTNQGHVSKKSQDLVKEEILSHKRKAVALKREGKTAEALEELRQAKLLERSLTSDELPPKASPDNGQVDLVKEQTSRSPAPRPLSGRDRFKLQQESLGHKRQALKLRREGRVQEAEAEFELAKALEAQLEESTSSDSAKPTASMSEDGVEDVLDPQLLSALKSIGLDDAVCTLSQNPEKPVPVKARSAKVENANAERIQLEEQIKAEKVKAVNFKRSGKQKEALDALRRAKLFEKKLNSMTSS